MSMVRRSHGFQHSGKCFDKFTEVLKAYIRNESMVVAKFKRLHLPAFGDRTKFEMCNGNPQVVHKKSEAVREATKVVFFALFIIPWIDYRAIRYSPLFLKKTWRITR